MSALDFIRSTEFAPPSFTEEHVELAFLKLKRKNQMDFDDVCVLMLQYMFEADPVVFTQWLRAMCCHSEFMSSLRARCRVFGKSSCHPFVWDLRAIVPMSSILRLLDRVLENRLQDFLFNVLLPVRGCFSAGKRYTQALDIGHAANLVMEKGLDQESEGAFAQADVLKYFDSLPILRILRWLIAQGADPALVGAIGRHQLLTLVVIHVRGAVAAIHNRSSGGLTGSFLALLLARIPMESSLYELQSSLEPCGFPVLGTKLLVATYIDNVYAASKFTSDACLNIELFFRHLQDCWGLEVKPGSKVVMATRGASDIQTVGNGWNVQDSVDVLGWQIQSDAGLQAQWRHLVPKLWGVFFKNLRQKGWRKLGIRRRFKLLSRTVKAVALRALSAWAPTPHYVDQLNKLQRKMASKVLNLFRYPGLEWRAFRSWESRVASRHVEEVAGGWWAQEWMSRSLAWNNHLKRDWQQQRRFLELPRSTLCCPSSFVTNLSWAAALVHYHDEDWFDARRIFWVRHDGLRVASRTGTRSAPGHVHMRWHDRINYCKRMVG